MVTGDLYHHSLSLRRERVRVRGIVRMCENYA